VKTIIKRYRAKSIEPIRKTSCAERQDNMGILVVRPAGEHAVFVDARAWWPHITPLAYQG